MATCNHFMQDLTDSEAFRAGVEKFRAAYHDFVFDIMMSLSPEIRARVSPEDALRAAIEIAAHIATVETFHAFICMPGVDTDEAKKMASEAITSASAHAMAHATHPLEDDEVSEVTH